MAVSHPVKFSILIFLISLFFSVWWIGFILILIVWFIILFSYIQKQGFSLFRYLVLFFSVVILIILLRLTVVDIYKDPSDSMETEIFSNDIFIVNKIKYGPVLPRTSFEIPYFNILFYVIKKEGFRWPYLRLKGLSRIKRDDIVVFDAPLNKGIQYVKRCVGLPGDTVLLRNSELLVNNILKPDQITIKHSYKIYAKDLNSLNDELYKSFNIVIPQKNDESKSVDLHLSSNDVKVVSKFVSVDSLKLNNSKASIPPSTYPYNKLFKWSLDNYGPVKVPFKGMKVLLNNSNYTLYKSILKKFEKVNQDINGNFYKNGSLIKIYTFTQDYYFMLGDNRNHSGDSRIWGLVPYENIIGQASVILYSEINGKFSWKRFMHEL